VRWTAGFAYARKCGSFLSNHVTSQSPISIIIEYEIESPDDERGIKVLRFHIVCQSIWQLECARYERPLKHSMARSSQ
jgi:hypothetical protein